MPKGDLTLHLTPLAQKLAKQFMYELVDVCLDKEPQGKYLRIYLDKEGGITLNDCEAYHRALIPLVEDYDYDFLEVSSPGVDRPLKTRQDFDRHMGQEVEVRLYKPMDKKKVLAGVLQGFDNGDVTLKVSGESKVIPQKAIALIKPVVDMTGVETVTFDDEYEA